MIDLISWDTEYHRAWAKFMFANSAIVFFETAMETTELLRKHDPEKKDKCLLDLSIPEWSPHPSTRIKSKGDREEETYYTDSGLSSIKKKRNGFDRHLNPNDE